MIIVKDLHCGIAISISWGERKRKTRERIEGGEKTGKRVGERGGSGGGEYDEIEGVGGERWRAFVKQEDTVLFNQKTRGYTMISLKKIWVKRENEK